MSLAASPEQETNMFKFHMLHANRDKNVITIPVILLRDFLENYEPLSLGIKHQVTVNPQCGYPKVWW